MLGTACPGNKTPAMIWEMTLHMGDCTFRLKNSATATAAGMGRANSTHRDT